VSHASSDPVGAECCNTCFGTQACRNMVTTACVCALKPANSSSVIKPSGRIFTSRRKAAERFISLKAAPNSSSRFWIVGAVATRLSALIPEKGSELAVEIPP